MIPQKPPELEPQIIKEGYTGNWFADNVMEYTQAGMLGSFYLFMIIISLPIIIPFYIIGRIFHKVIPQYIDPYDERSSVFDLMKNKRPSSHRPDITPVAVNKSIPPSSPNKIIE